MTDNYSVDINNVNNLLSEIENASIVPGNYEEWRSKTKGMSNMADMQVQNDTENLNNAIEEFTQLKEDRHVVESIKNDIVPKKLFDHMMSAYKSKGKLYQWADYERVYLRALTQKLFKLIDGIDAMALRKDLMTEFKESDKMRLEMMENVLNSQLKIIDEKVVSQNQMVFERFDQLNKFTISALEGVIGKTNDTNMQIVKEVGVMIPNKIKIDIEEFTEKLLQKIPQNDIVKKMAYKVPPVVQPSVPVSQPRPVAPPRQMSPVEEQKLQETREMYSNEKHELASPEDLGLEIEEQKAENNKDIVEDKKYNVPTKKDLESDLDDIDIFG
jgi:hypothetical protein